MSLKDFFLSPFVGIDPIHLISDALVRADDGELYLESSETQSLSLEQGRVKTAALDQSQGFGLRAVKDAQSVYAHSSNLTAEDLKQACQVVRSMEAGTSNVSPTKTPHLLYPAENPLDGFSFSDQVDFLHEIDAYLMAQDPRIAQVMVSLATSWKRIGILRASGQWFEDSRPLVRLNISVLLKQGERQEVGSAGAGGRLSLKDFLTPETWTNLANEALRGGRVNLEARPSPAGEMPVVLGSGWPGVLLHEAVGHGLEGDFNRKGTSTYSNRMGQRVASKGVTVIDDGTLEGRRGSLNFDDEGTPTQRNVLIEDGILVGYLQDRQNARLMGMAATGNGRRESYAHTPMPRMTNTFMLAGNTSQQEMIREVKRGIYAANFGGGQVDITSGKFVFSSSEAYMIENGEITYPIKGATLIGTGPETMQRIQAIGNDLALDPGVGTCGKNGQSVPVGVGQPSLLISGMTVGGTEV